MSSNITHAMLLAAGLGTRMRPLTHQMPKPLIRVAGKPLVDWCLDWLQAGGIREVVVNTSYLAQQLEAHLALRHEPRLHVSREGTPPLETGGGIAQALPRLGNQPFLAMNSDAILPPVTPHPIHRLAAAWDDAVDFLLLLVPKSQACGWSGNGDFVMDGDGRIRRPMAGEEAPYIFTGIELIHPRAFADCPPGAFPLGLLWRRGMAADGWFNRCRAILHEGAWLHVGDLEGLAAAEAYSSLRGNRA